MASTPEATGYLLTGVAHAPGVQNSLLGKIAMKLLPPAAQTANVEYGQGAVDKLNASRAAASPAAQAAQAAGVPGSDTAATLQETATNDSRRSRRGRVATILNSRRSQLQSYEGGAERLGG